MITIDNLHKRYGPIRALRGIDVAIRQGSVTAVAGPNGSGKTTLIKSILGLVKPDTGSIMLDGMPLNGNAGYRRLIGYMPQAGQFPENLRVREVLNLVKSIRGDGVDSDECLIEALNLEREMRKRIRTLSGGTRQKLGAAIAFMFPSRLFILDEPTAGLDPVSSGILKAEIRRRKEHGHTIILTSHIISEIEELADDIVFLCDGNILFAGGVATLRETTGQDRLEAALAALMNGNSR